MAFSSHLLQLDRNVERPWSSVWQLEKQVERLLVDSVLKVEGLKGQYFPLAGSDSYAPKPGGMSSQEEKALADDHLLFYHPDAPAVLSTGAGRHWPHGRGIFVNDRKTITLWINEEDGRRDLQIEHGIHLHYFTIYIHNHAHTVVEMGVWCLYRR